MRELKLIRNKTEEVASWIDDDPLLYYVTGQPSKEVTFKELLWLESVIEVDDTEFTASPNSTLDMLETVISTHSKDDKYEWSIEER
jgi:hypothetical protein